MIDDIQSLMNASCGIRNMRVWCAFRQEGMPLKTVASVFRMSYNQARYRVQKVDRFMERVNKMRPSVDGRITEN